MSTVDLQPRVLLVVLSPAVWRDLDQLGLQQVVTEFAVSRPLAVDEAMQQARALRPAVAIICAGEWGQREAAFVANLRGASPRTALCLTTAQTPDPFAIAVEGVRGWLWSSDRAEQWLRAVRALASGGSWLLPLFASWMLLNLEFERVPLTREMEILRRVRRGEQYGEVAAALDTTAVEVKRGIRRALDAVIDILNGLDDGGYEASGDRAPRPRPDAPGSLNAALPLPPETPPPLHAFGRPVDGAMVSDERRRHSA